MGGAYEEGKVAPCLRSDRALLRPPTGADAHAGPSASDSFVSLLMARLTSLQFSSPRTRRTLPSRSAGEGVGSMLEQWLEFVL